MLHYLHLELSSGMDYNFGNLLWAGMKLSLCQDECIASANQSKDFLLMARHGGRRTNEGCDAGNLSFISLGPFSLECKIRYATTTGDNFVCSLVCRTRGSLRSTNS